jgi:hypothetical protein
MQTLVDYSSWYDISKKRRRKTQNTEKKQKCLRILDYKYHILEEFAASIFRG